MGIAASAAMGANDVAYRCANNDICLLDPDTPSSIVNLSFNDSTSAEGYPFWSPDGVKVGFTSSFPNVGGPGSIENLFVMNPSAPGQTINGAVQLTHYSSSSGAVREAEWSPDGSKVAYQYETGGASGVYVVNADGSSASPTTISAIGTSALKPTFSPDGTKIAYSIGEQVYIANADGSGIAQPLAGAQCHSPAWSPAGTKIACDKNKSFGMVDVNIVNADGTGTPVVLTLSGSQFSFATWSPDGGRIAFRDTFGGGFGYFRVANADGTGDHPLVKVQNQNDNDTPSWSPDGSRLAFSAYSYDPTTMSGTTDLHIVNADGTGSDQTLTSGHKEYDAAWRPQKGVTLPVQPPLAGPTIKPKVVWITKRIPYSEAPYVQGPAISCPSGSSDARCVAAAQANGRGGGRTTGGHVVFRAGSKKVLVAKTKATIAPGKTKRLRLKVTKAGKKFLRKRRSANLDVTLKIAIAGQKTVVSHHVLRLYVKPKKK